MKPMKNLICGECGETKPSEQFSDTSSNGPHCKECVKGFYDTLGDDPHGKDWE